MTRRNTPSRWILVVTDDRGTRESTRRILTEVGYRLETSRTCANALRRTRRRRPAAILVDLMATSEECSAFVAACRQECGSASPPILVMAATPRAALGAIQAGAQGYVKTPPERGTMVPMLSQVRLRSVDTDPI